AIAERSFELRATLDAMADGVVMLDRALEYLVWNDRFLELFDFPADLLAPGPDGARPTLERTLRFQAARGDLGAGDPDALVAAALAAARREPPRRRRATLPLALPRGRLVEMRMSPLPNGGLVRVFTDVTERERS